MKKKEILVMLISEFADWECAFLSAALNGRLADADPKGKVQAKYTVKTIGLSKEHEHALSFGGLKTVIDYDIHSCPNDYAALILIGGSSWKTEKVKLILPALGFHYISLLLSPLEKWSRMNFSTFFSV